jgi:gluconolactonase
MAKRRVSRQESDGNITVLTSTYNGKKYNSPNDLVVKSDGSIFFTDPDFNTPKGQTKELTFKGIFRISPFGQVYALDSTTFDKPNGICFSPDETKLYVNESPKRIIYVWDVVNDSTISNKRTLYTIPGTDYMNYADGMKVDTDGNIYCTGPGGVWIISPSGVNLGKISMTETPSNCAWGDADKRTLYITAGSSLYRIRLSATNINKNQGQNIPNNFHLFQNYPNPFNPNTVISCQFSVLSNVNLKVYDVLGREVATLLNQQQPAGSFKIEFNGKHLTSGLYICRLQADQFSESIKMLLTK